MPNCPIVDHSTYPNKYEHLYISRNFALFTFLRAFRPSNERRRGNRMRFVQFTNVNWILGKLLTQTDICELTNLSWMSFSATAKTGTTPCVQCTNKYTLMSEHVCLLRIVQSKVYGKNNNKNCTRKVVVLVFAECSPSLRMNLTNKMWSWKELKKIGNGTHNIKKFN